MSEERVLLDYLNDILESIADIREFTAGINREGFFNDKKTIKAVVRSLEVIGEAVSKLPDNIREMYPEIPWQETVAMRNRLIHEYFGVDLDIVWQTIEEDLSPLDEIVKRMLEEMS
ncbi:MAG: DUF86 domain-containing protein [Thermodesulfovibrionales bacterium]|nr:DUF86 domain-containing protein [Thermodesulfovibrionales bacterium]